EKLFLPDEEDHHKFEETTKVYLCSGAEIEHEKFVRDGDTLLLVRGGQPHHPQTFRSFLLSSVAHASSSSSASSAASSPLVPPKHKGKQEDKEAEGAGEGGGESAVVVASGGRALHYLLSSRALVVGRRGEEGEGEEGEVEGEGEEAKRLRLLLRPLGEGEQEAKQEHKLEDILTLFIQHPNVE
ncbi:START domain-containing protein, partial [Balamuthia mandrillaris]